VQKNWKDIMTTVTMSEKMLDSWRLTERHYAQIHTNTSCL